ncbi:MAG: NfeD family protein [Rhizobiaceae bacterium]|nr:NfeD family protein [Rhizobiaceae bacterium]
MIARLAAELGPWNWMVLGFALLALEIVVPGFFLLWIGLAAIVTGALSLALWDASWWMWQVQVLVFLALSLVAAWGGRKVMGSDKAPESDLPLLNLRAAQMIGRTATLTEPIRNGRGRVQLGDTMWRIAGPDLPVGATIRVTAASDADLELVVEAA